MLRFVNPLLAICLVSAMAACGSDTTTGGNSSPTAPGASQILVGPDERFKTIQSAVDAATTGSTISVRAGTYGEHVVISKALTIQGQQAVLDGLTHLDGRYLGFEVRSSNVTISDFVVQNFEQGIVVDHVSSFRLLRSEVRSNTSKDPPPTSTGVTKSDGVVLIQVQGGEISGNFIHDNGSIGLWLSVGSSGNIVRSNRFVNNGTQQRWPGGGGFSGVGILTSKLNNNRNIITDNDVSNSDWGIQIGGSPDSENVVTNNRVHANRRAGIAIFGQHNQISANDAAGNALETRAPSCGLDLMNFGGLENDWGSNTGRFGMVPAFGPLTCP